MNLGAVLDNRKSFNFRKENVIIRQDRVLPIDARAIDVLCVNCYECIKFDDVDRHSRECMDQPRKTE